MNKIFTIALVAGILNGFSQTQIANSGFENWGGNPAPGVVAEPTGWYSNKSGSNTAQLGPQLCYKDGTVKHSGLYSVRVETTNYLGTAVNGAVTTGVINAPTFTKSDGNIGTVNYSSASDVRRMNFTGRPDSLVGWYQYTSGGAGEQPKVRAILHTSNYWDPETPTTYHAACIANKIGDALWIGNTGNQSTWRRFSVPFTYTSAATPAYIMVNVTSSANQNTTVTGSKLWLDDLDVIYNPTGISENEAQKVKIYNYCKVVYADMASKKPGKCELFIIDLTGKVVSSHNLDSDKVNSFDLSTLPDGLYIYKLNVAGWERSGKILLD